MPCVNGFTSRASAYTPRMSLEVRPAHPEEMPEVVRIVSRELAMPADAFAGMNPDWTLCGVADGSMATTYAAWPLTIRFNGRAVPMAGVTWVSTHPAHRRKGYLRAVVRRHFEQLHEEGRVALAGLHPAAAAIYRRYGYGTITERHTYRFDPRDLVFAHAAEVPGRLREVDPEAEFGLLVDIYRRYREDRNALVHRGRAMWLSGPLAPPPAGMRQVVLVYEEEGDAVGYAVFNHGPGLVRHGAGPGQQLRVEDFFALTANATRALWRAIASYDAVGEITWNNAGPDDPLPHMLVEPRMLNPTVRDGIMVRLVTVDRALALRPYPVDEEVTFRLVDEVCPWNAGDWRLSTAAEGGAMRRADGERMDATLGPDTLAQIAWGFLRPSVAWRAGLLEVENPGVLERWDDAFRTAHPPHEAEHTW